MIYPFWITSPSFTQLLGGKVRDRVGIYCDSGAREMIPGDERSKARISQIREMGFTAAKIDIDDATDPARMDRVNWTASNAEIEHMMAKIAFTRELYPKNFDLAVDMHARYDATTGKRVAKEAEPFKLMWLEEPVPAENIDAMRDIRATTSTPICCGENIYMRWGFREILEKRAADIIMPDFQKTGGLLEARKIAEVDGQAKRLSRQIPKRDFEAGQRRDILPGLRPGEHAGGADPFECRLDIERVLPH